MTNAGACVTGKIPFATAAEARLYCTGDRGDWRPYRCEICGQFHLTRKSKTQYRRARRAYNSTDSPNTRRPR